MAGAAAKYTGARAATNWAASKTAAGARTAVGYFKGRINGYVIEMEQEASALLDALDGRPGVMATAPRPAGWRR